MMQMYAVTIRRQEKPCSDGQNTPVYTFPCKSQTIEFEFLEANGKKHSKSPCKYITHWYL